MDSILQKLYHGMIHPEEDYQPMSEKHRQAQKALTKKKEALLQQIRKDDSALSQEIEELMEEENGLGAMAFGGSLYSGHAHGRKACARATERKGIKRR